jgi:hypothetical protein
MMPHPAERPRKRARTLPIPLRPEVIEFMDPQSLCRFSSVSATLRKDVFEAKAWEIMANARMPPRSAHEAALAAERDATTRVKEYMCRRMLRKHNKFFKKLASLPRGVKYADLKVFFRIEYAGRVLGEDGPTPLPRIISRIADRLRAPRQMEMFFSQVRPQMQHLSYYARFRVVLALGKGCCGFTWASAKLLFSS